MVESQMDDTLVYSVVQMIPGSTSRILHSNMLHPAHSIQPKDGNLLGEEQDLNNNTHTYEPSEKALTALAKANALMDIYFSD